MQRDALTIFSVPDICASHTQKCHRNALDAALGYCRALSSRKLLGEIARTKKARGV